MSIEQQLSTLFEERQFDALYDATSQQFQDFIDRTKFQLLCTEFWEGTTRFKLTHQNPFLHMHNYVWTDDRAQKAIFASIDRQGVIQGLYMKVYQQFKQDDKHYTKNMYLMPILGEWYVFWGGANEFQNYHYPYENQRYAYDLVKVEQFTTFHDNPEQVTNYYAFNEMVVAPFEGTVIAVENELPDNEIGTTDEVNAAGNYIVMEHPFGEFSFLAHFKQHSILVKPGDKVYAGQPIGRCGNSGNSSEPHIHFHVMDGADYNASKSIRIRFKDRFEPVQGSAINSISYQEKAKVDVVEKGEMASMLIDIFTFIPRIIGAFFK